MIFSILHKDNKPDLFVMIRPEYLKTADKVALVAPARKVSLEEMQLAKDTLESWELEVILGDNLFKEYHQFAGTDEQRTKDMQEMLDNPSIKAIFCARGGYGTVRIIDNLDFRRFTRNPKWIIGYSDVTVMHSHIHSNFKVESMHATMPINFSKNNAECREALSSLKKALFGEKLSYEILSQQYNALQKKGEAKGILVGGNLSLLYSLIGSTSDIDTTDKILFLEDVDEYLYHIDRMIMNLKRNNKLNRLKGLIVGSMSEMKDNAVAFGKTAEEIIFDNIKEYHYPVCFGFPSGHTSSNKALILGREIKIHVEENISLEFL